MIIACIDRIKRILKFYSTFATLADGNCWTVTFPLIKHFTISVVILSRFHKELSANSLIIYGCSLSFNPFLNILNDKMFTVQFFQ